MSDRLKNPKIHNYSLTVSSTILNSVPSLELGTRISSETGVKGKSLDSDYSFCVRSIKDLVMEDPSLEPSLLTIIRIIIGVNTYRSKNKMFTILTDL
jgi:hypothetical protein